MNAWCRLAVVSFAISSLGCAGMENGPPWLQSIFPRSLTLAERCELVETDKFVPLALDSEWLESRIDCPATGRSTVGFKSYTTDTQLVTFRIEVVSGDGLLSVMHTDSSGQQFMHVLSSEERKAIFVVAVEPETAILVATPGTLTFRIRNDPKRRTPRPPPPRGPQGPVAGTPGPPEPPEPTDAPDEPESPEPPPAGPPAPPGTRLVGLMSIVGDPVRKLRIDQGSDDDVLIGQTGRVLVDGQDVARFCIDEVYPGSAAAKLARPIADDTLASGFQPRIELSTRRTRSLRLLRSSGNPIRELELRGGSRDCFRRDMRGSLVLEDGTQAGFQLGRVESNRAWATLDDPLDRGRARGASAVLDLGSAAPVTEPEAN